jgi:mRNA interferase MazF
MRRGEIYFVDLDPIIGREQSGRRPVLVLSTDAINRAPLVVTVVPGTTATGVRRFRTSVLAPAAESGLPNDTYFLCFQIRALDHSRFPANPAGRLSTGLMQDVEDTIRFCLGL